MLRIVFLQLALLVFVLTPDLAFAQKAFKVGVVAFYNLENLFDTINDPNINDEEFLPAGQNRWNAEKYTIKLDRLSEAIEGIGTDVSPFGAHILGVSEIENREVLEDLVASERLKNRNYQIIHYDSPDRRGVDVAMLYQADFFEPTNTKSYFLEVEGMPHFRSRDQLVVSGLFEGEVMHFIVNHWPSRYGGEKRSRPLRMAAAALNRHIVDSLLLLDAEAKIVVMGDLNDNPTNKSVLDVLAAKGQKTNLKSAELYNPYYDLYKKGIGSNAYRDAWSLFDQLIISQALIGDDYETYQMKYAKVYFKPEMTQTSGRFKGYPFRTFAGGVFLGGYSDHFPAYIVLIKEVKQN
ncbi:MAG: endonuclease/exonuclease/phosphatase family protein [Bacteroidales bacterium]|jgi:hypothetical protein|nr:endonuclease/exonuclease/phosphatase family protein [Bacteroidales bacterium]HOI32073.1 endonuclease/exonuclease/phosphatase family protein [Bacteroidales bacterium]